MKGESSSMVENMVNDLIGRGLNQETAEWGGGRARDPVSGREKEPVKTSVVDSKIFHCFIYGTIILNALTLGMQADFQTGSWPLVWLIFENVFTAVFTIEMVLKIYFLRLEYFWNAGGPVYWNLLDFAAGTRGREWKTHTARRANQRGGRLLLRLEHPPLSEAWKTAGIEGAERGRRRSHGFDRFRQIEDRAATKIGPAARLADAALQMAARNVSLAVKVIDRFPERQKQAWPWRPALYFARLVLAALPAPRTDADRAVAAPAAPTGPGAALRGAELRWLSGRLGVVGLLVPPSALNRAPHMKQIPKVVLNRQEQHSAFSECVAVLESNQVQYFPSRGTLIGLVRYGDLQGKLSGFKVDVVDRDMDWMVHVDSADSWFHLAQQISASLLDKGWHSCQLTVASEVLCLGEIHSMKCIRIEPYVASVDFDAYHLLPGRLCLGFRDEQLSSPYRRCAETAETAVDRGAETGAAGAARRCFGAQEVFPLQKCRAPVVGSVPCPRDPVAYLAQLYDAETSAALTASRARRCWALPSITESRAPNDPRNQLLRQQGLNGSDVALLRRSAEELHGEGYASFREELERCNVSSEALEDVMQGSFGKWSLLRKSSKVIAWLAIADCWILSWQDINDAPLLRAMQLLRIIRIAKLIGLRQELVAGKPVPSRQLGASPRYNGGDR
eukprot:g22985.t1